MSLDRPVQVADDQVRDPAPGPAVVIYLAIVYLLDVFLRWLERASRIPGFEAESRRA